ncbi:MAG: response regulator [Nitrosomonadales bacterium]|nr:response regulator [Nitrosomonadales bacterium]
MRKILIVEDNPTNMSFFVAVLEHGGHTVLQAGDAATGIRLAREAHPRSHLHGHPAPRHGRAGSDWLEATRQLKADPATRTIPIYALTAFAMKGDEERICAAGCDGYLDKPASYKNLLATVGAAWRPLLQHKWRHKNGNDYERRKTAGWTPRYYWRP